MKWLLFSSLRTRLILLVLTAIIPALMMTLYSGLEQRKHARLDALIKHWISQKVFLKTIKNSSKNARQTVKEWRVTVGIPLAFSTVSGFVPV